MQIDDRLYALLAPQAARVKIEQVCVGLRYTAVTTSDGGMGLAYTFNRADQGRAIPSEYTDCEGRPATVLLEKIRENAAFDRGQALALINALNYGHALLLPEDPDNQLLYDFICLDAAPKVAMVGYFPPLAAYLQDRGVALEIVEPRS